MSLLIINFVSYDNRQSSEGLIWIPFKVSHEAYHQNAYASD